MDVWVNGNKTWKKNYLTFVSILYGYQLFVSELVLSTDVSELILSTVCEWASIIPSILSCLTYFYSEDYIYKLFSFVTRSIFKPGLTLYLFRIWYIKSTYLK